MTIKRNILANYVGVGIAILAPILALPWYLGALGPKQFGLISFILMLQAVLGLLDAGMSQAVIREVTVRFDSANGRRSAALLLFGFERIYWIFALSVASVTLLLADPIAINWLKLDGLSIELGREAVYGAAVIFAVQFPGSIYRSLLVGAQAQVAFNSIMLLGVLLRHVGGVIVVLVWPKVTAYLIWYALVSLLETLVRNRWAWSALGVKRNEVKWDINELRSAWKLAAVMSGATLLGALTVQIDKIVLSRMVSIEQFGYYTIAAMVSAGMLQLIYPLVQALLPRAIQLREDAVALRRLSIKLVQMISLIVGLGALIFVATGDWLLGVWLRNPLAVEAIYPLLAILLVGTALNAFYNVGYIFWIVHERPRRIFYVNFLALVLSMVLIPLLVTWQGTIGAAFGWLAINLIGFIFSLGWIIQKNEKEV